MKIRAFSCCILAAASLGACATRGASDAPVQAEVIIRGATIAQVQNAIVDVESRKGWTIVRQSQNQLVMAHDFDSFLFSVLTSARSSQGHAIYQFVTVDGGVDVLGSIVLIADQGNGNMQRVPDARDLPAMQRMLGGVQTRLSTTQSPQ